MDRTSIARKLSFVAIAAIVGVVVFAWSSAKSADAGDGGTFFLEADPVLIFPGDSLEVDVNHQGSTLGAILTVQYDPTQFVLDDIDEDPQYAPLGCTNLVPGAVNCPVGSIPFGLPPQLTTLVTLEFTSNLAISPGPTGMNLVVEDCAPLGGELPFRASPQGEEVACDGFGTPIHVLSLAPLPHTWGDVDCDQEARIGDAQKIARTLIALPANQQQPCPGIGHFAVFGEYIGQLGDVDCNGQFTIGDAQKLARSLIDLPVSQTQPCPPLEEQIFPPVP